MNKNIFKNTIAGISAFSLIASGTSAFAATTTTTNKTTTKTTTAKKVVAKPVVNKKVVNNYKNGEYTASGFYKVPYNFSEDVSLTVKLENNKIVDASLMAFSDKPTSLKFQDLFIAGFKDQVVGKNIDEVKLGIVNGSSLTSVGFMDALNKIKKQAKK